MEHSIGQTVAALRKERGWTQSELADRLQVSNKTVSKWEQDGGAPSVEFYPRLAELFEVTIDYLMTGKDGKRGESMGCLRCGNKEYYEIALFKSDGFVEVPKQAVVAYACKSCGHIELIAPKALLDEYAEKERLEKERTARKETLTAEIEKIKADIARLERVIENENRTIKNVNEAKADLKKRQEELKQKTKELEDLIAGKSSLARGWAKFKKWFKE